MSIAVQVFDKLRKTVESCWMMLSGGHCVMQCMHVLVQKQLLQKLDV